MAWFEHGTSRIYYQETGSGDPVLLLPGWSESIEDLAELRKALSTRYRVIAADLPGSGRSEPQPRTYTASYFDDDARSFAALLEHLKTGPAHLIGFSDGGEVALLMAATMPNVARSVVVWGAAGKLQDPGGHLRAVMHDVIDNPIPPMQGFAEGLVAMYGEANARTMTRNLVGAIGEIIEGREGDVSMSKAVNITCPVLIIVGEHDMFVPVPLATEMASRIPGGKVVEATGAGHAVQHDSPDWLAQTILDWLESRQVLPSPANGRRATTGG